MEELTPVERSWAEAMPGRAAEGCLEAGQILELAESGKRCHDYSARIAHIAICPSCRGTLKMLAATEAARPRKRFVLFEPLARYVVAGAVAALLIAIWFGSSHGGNPGHPGGSLASGAGAAPKAPDIVKSSPKPSPGAVAVRPNSIPVAPPNRQPRRFAVRHRPHGAPHRTPLRNEPRQPIMSRAEGESGVLEGSVTAGDVIEGEVGAVGGVVEGEVTHRKPPP